MLHLFLVTISSKFTSINPEGLAKVEMIGGPVQCPVLAMGGTGSASLSSPPRELRSIMLHCQSHWHEITWLHCTVRVENMFVHSSVFQVVSGNEAEMQLSDVTRSITSIDLLTFRQIKNGSIVMTLMILKCWHRRRRRHRDY